MCSAGLIKHLPVPAIKTSLQMSHTVLSSVLHGFHHAVYIPHCYHFTSMCITIKPQLERNSYFHLQVACIVEYFKFFKKLNSYCFLFVCFVCLFVFWGNIAIDGRFETCRKMGMVLFIVTFRKLPIQSIVYNYYYIKYTYY